MSKFLLLIKINLFNTFKLNKLTKKNRDGRISILKVLLVLWLAISTFAIAFFYVFVFSVALAEGGKPELIFPFGLFLGVAFTIIVTLTTSNAYLFRSRDFDLLMSLPIIPGVIISSKISYLFMINYLSFSLIFIPASIVHSLYNSTSIEFWLLSVPTFLIIPVLPITISSIIAFVLGFLGSKFKYKNLVSIIFSLILIIFISFISFRTSAIQENPEQYALAIENILTNTGQIFVYQGMQGDFVKYLVFVAISIIPFIGYIYLLGKYYLHAYTKINRVYLNKNFKMSTLKKTDQNKALRIKELKRYFGSYIYVTNTIIGPVLAIVFVALMYVSLQEIVEMFQNVLGLLLTITVSFSLGIISTTSCSISIEGKQFWILKSSPISAQQVFHAKMFINLLITIPIIIVIAIISFFLFSIYFVDVIFMIIIPSLLAIYMSYIGLYSNLNLPRFDYENDVKAVKQSLSVLITMFFGFIGSFIIIGLGYVGFTYLGSNVAAYLLATVGGLTLTILSATLVYTHGVKLYNRLSS